MFVRDSPYAEASSDRVYHERFWWQGCLCGAERGFELMNLERMALALVRVGEEAYVWFKFAFVIAFASALVVAATAAKHAARRHGGGLNQLSNEVRGLIVVRDSGARLLCDADRLALLVPGPRVGLFAAANADAVARGCATASGARVFRLELSESRRQLPRWRWPVRRP